jgi:transposase-like protein
MTNTFSQLRKERAKQILEKSEPQIIDENTFLVKSQNSNKKYKVTYYDTFSCDCQDFQKRCKGHGRFCKHIQSIILYNKIKQVINQQEEVFILGQTENKTLCPHCNSTNLIKRGIRQTKLKKVQRYGCKDCKKRFTLEPIKHIKVNYKFVTLAMDCYFKGLSYRDIADQFKQFYNVNLHHETIRRWVLRFSKVLNEYSKTIKPNIKGVWNADEILVMTKRGKDKKQPNKNYDYLWNCMDNKTKFLFASVNSGRSRKSKDAQKVFTEAYKQNGVIPYQIITDGFKGYQDGCRKAFRNWGNERKVKFTSIVGHRKEVNNNAIESHHTQQKEFHKVRKGVTETQTYQDGFKVFHNYIRKSAKQGLTPAEKCNLTIPNQNRWIGLLRENIQQIKQEVPIVTEELKCRISP